MCIWDFMLKRNDGTVCFLHPNWSNNKVEFYEGLQEGIPNGIGSGGNQGYFKRAAMRVDRILTFDKSKTPRGVRVGRPTGRADGHAHLNQNSLGEEARGKE